MKETLKRLAILLALLLAGVLVGSAASAPVNGLALDWRDYLGAMILAPAEMTFGVPLVFSYYSALCGVLVVAGGLATAVSFAWGMARAGVWPRVGTFAGAVLWSLGNIPGFCAFMSV